MERTRTALVLGTTGGIGGEVARNLRDRGWAIRALNRDPARVAGRDGFDWRQGDAMVAAEVARAAGGASLIVHAVNPPGYRDWDRLVLPMMDNTIAAARSVGARVLLPGTIYNYGPDAWPVLREDAAQNPTTRKGRIRVALERRLEDAAAQGVRSIVLRAGDYFGPRPGNSWFSQSLVTPGRVPRAIRTPGRPGVGHQWAYLPDVAEAMARLVERDGPEPFGRFHFAGHWDPDGAALPEAIRRVLGRPDLPLRRFPWTLARLAGPVVPLMREISEMRPLWETPIRMENARLVAAIGPEPHTSLDEAVRRTLAGLGCLPPGRARPAVDRKEAKVHHSGIDARSI